MPGLAVVTGASSGIGKAYAEELASRGFDLIAVGRRKERLDELRASLAGVTVEPLVADLATDDGIDTVAEVCGTRPLTILVNNAGVAHYMPFAELPADKAAELIRVKELAPTMLTRAAVPGMLERGEGTIINVAGMIAFSGPARSKCPAGPSIPERSLTRSPGPSSFTPSWRQTASRFRSSARAWSPPSFTHVRAWT